MDTIKYKDFLRVINVLDHGAKGDGVTDDTAAIQAALNASLALGIAASNDFYCPTVRVPGGVYKVSSTISYPPAVKLVAEGNVIFDFSTLAVGSTAFRIDPELWTLTTMSSMPGQGAASTSPFLDGTSGSILILGPGTDTTNKGIDLGGVNSAQTNRSTRHTMIANVQVDGFGINLFLRSINVYLATFNRLMLRNSLLAQVQIDPAVANSNSGENLVFQNCILFSGAAGSTCLDYKVRAFDITFNSCSFDFVKDSVVRIGTGVQSADFAKLVFNDCHIERSFDTAIIDSQLTANPSSLEIHLVNTAVIAGDFYRNKPLFKGRFTLYVDNCRWAGYNNFGMNAVTGLYLADDLTTVLRWKGGTFVSSRVLLPSSKLVVNEDASFESGVIGSTFLRNTPLTGWTVENYGGLTATIANDKTFSGTKSLKLTSTASSNYFQFVSTAFPIAKMDRITASAVINGEGSTGNVAVETYVEYFKEIQRPPISVSKIKRSGTTLTVFTDTAHRLVTGDLVIMDGLLDTNYNGRRWLQGVTDTAKTIQNISSITRSGSTVTVTTAAAHGLVVGEGVTIAGATQSDYNGTFQVVSVASTTFTYTISTTPTTPATGTPTYSMAHSFFYRLDSATGSTLAVDYASVTPIALTRLGQVQIGNMNMSTLWANTADLDYAAGSRNIWAKSATNSYAINSFAGATHARLKMGINSIGASGESVWIGGIYCAVIES